VRAQKLENVVNTSKSPPAFQEINLFLMATYEKKPPRLMHPRPSTISTNPFPTEQEQTITFNFGNLAQTKSLQARDSRKSKNCCIYTDDCLTFGPIALEAFALSVTQQELMVQGNGQMT
jgi:hypothetical protein